MEKPQKLSESDKNRALPPDAQMMLGNLASSQLSPEAKKDLRSYARFYIWAIPLFNLGQVNIHSRMIEFGLMVSKRFMIGKDENNLPIIAVQTSEMDWMVDMPWSFAGVHFKSGRIMLLSRPHAPLSSSGFVIPVDIPTKLAPLKGQRYIEIREMNPFIDPKKLRAPIRLELKEIKDGFFTKTKMKNKL